MRLNPENKPGRPDSSYSFANRRKFIRTLNEDSRKEVHTEEINIPKTENVIGNTSKKIEPLGVDYRTLIRLFLCAGASAGIVAAVLSPASCEFINNIK